MKFPLTKAHGISNESVLNTLRDMVESEAIRTIDWKELNYLVYSYEERLSAQTLKNHYQQLINLSKTDSSTFFANGEPELNDLWALMR